MRAVRRAVPDPEARSVVLGASLRKIEAVAEARVVMAFHALPGEPDLGELARWCRARGATVVVPEDEPDPATVDVVLVPGLAFTPTGDRLGQGGGWYDRFLSRRRPGTVTIGIGFREQLVDVLPSEPHDVRLDHIVTA